MGGNQSNAYRHRPVIAQKGFPGVIQARFVRNRPVTLVLRDQLRAAECPGHEFEIKDAATGQVVFRVARDVDLTSDTSDRTLYDAFNVPIARLERKSCPPSSAKYAVIPGGPTSTGRLCEIDTRLNGMEQPMRIHFVDHHTGDQVVVGQHGRNWRGRSAAIFIQRGEEGMGYGIAKIYRTFEMADDPDAYVMEIAPGVDTALMVLIAWALDEQHKIHGNEKAAITFRRGYDKDIAREAKKNQKQQALGRSEPTKTEAVREGSTQPLPTAA